MAAGSISISYATSQSPTDVDTLSGSLYEPRVGIWHIETVVTGDELPEGQAVISFADEINLSGFIAPKRSIVDTGRAMIRLDAGSGQLKERVPAKSFRKAKLGDILNALAFETGDQVEPASQFLDLEIPYWTWGTTVGEATLHALAAHAKCAWRFTRDGTLWFGLDSWEAIETIAPEFTYQQGQSKPGETIIWPDGLPLVRPGYTFQGKRVGEVLTTWTEGGALQQQIVFELGATPTRFARSIQTSVVDQFDRTRGQELDLSKEYPCEVTGQSADLRSVDLMPDDDVVKGSGLRNVPLRFGAPGLLPRLKIGARCHLGWEAADPSRPYAALFEADGVIEYRITPDSGSDITLVATGGANVNLTADGGTVNINGANVKVNGGGLQVAHKYSLVSMGLPTATAPGSPCALPLPGAPAQLGIVVSGFVNFEGG